MGMADAPGVYSRGIMHSARALSRRAPLPLPAQHPVCDLTGGPLHIYSRREMQRVHVSTTACDTHPRSASCGAVLCRGTLSQLVRYRSMRAHLVRRSRITATRNASRRRLRCSGRIVRSACTSASRGISEAAACGSDRVRLARSMTGSSRRIRSDRWRSSAVLAQGCTCSDVACACMPPKNLPGAT